MPDTKITALTAIGANPIIPSTFPIPMVDLTDTSMAASGTTKKVTVNQILGAGGTATLASATITGDLTVRTTGLTTTASAVGINTASPTANTLTIGANRFIICSDSQSKFGDNGLINGAAADGNTQIQFFGSKSLFFNEGVSTRMTLNATGLAIGDTAFAGTRLTLRESASQPNALAMTNRNATQTWRIGVDVSAVDDKILGFYDSTSTTFRMQLTDTGNLGIGVTPSAWGAAFKAAQLTYGGLYSQAFTVAGIAANCYNAGAGGWTYFGSGQTASRYEQSVGTHAWYTAVAGTGAIGTFTQAMTLDASGNLLVGTTTNTNGSRIFSRGTATSSALALQGASGDVALAQLTVGKFDNNTTTSQIFVRFTINDNSGGSGQINANGASQAAFGTFSDSRLKENIVSLPSQLANILSLRPVEFDYKDGSGHQIGFVAQEVQEVYSDAVSEQDGFLTVTGWSKTEARLVSAIKELAAKVQALEAKLA